jgi:hypothetical protein
MLVKNVQFSFLSLNPKFPQIMYELEHECKYTFVAIVAVNGRALNKKKKAYTGKFYRYQFVEDVCYINRSTARMVISHLRTMGPPVTDVVHVQMAV